MRALVYDSFAGPIDIRDVPDPECPDGGAVIEVAATGLCRSDWHGWVGHDPGIALPHVPGHEFAGTVVEVGRDVQRVAVGQRVTVPFVCACGVCEQCRAGEQQVCLNQLQPGFERWGSFAQRVAITAADVNVVALPNDLGFDVAASLGCRYATAYRAVVVHGRVANDNWVAVHGCGGLGLSAVQIAASRGARVIAVDVSATARDRALALGATAVIAAESEPVVKAIRERSGGGAHVSLDTLGSTTTCRNSIGSLRRRGRHVQVGLMVGDDARPPIPMGLVLAKELELYGSHGMAAHAYPDLLAEIAAGTLRPQELIGDHIGLAAAGAALIVMDTAPPSGITIIDPSC